METRQQKHFGGFRSNQGSAYIGPAPFGTSTELVRISLVFTRDLVDPARIGSATARPRQ